MCKGKIIITDTKAKRSKNCSLWISLNFYTQSVENILLLINYNNFVVQIKKDG